jgi:single-strand DNA-binding protein
MLNVVALNGRMVQDPELKHTNSDIPVCSFTLAVDRSYVKQGQERQADFINIVAWRGTAEFCSKYFVKGQLIAVEGSIQTRKYTDRDGNKRTAFEVVANNVHFAEPKHNGMAEIERNARNAGVTVNNSDNGDFVEISDLDDPPF